MNQILRVEVGSTAYGTNIPGQSDRDELSIIVEPKATVFDLNRLGFKTIMTRPKPQNSPSEPGDTELTTYSLRSFLELAAAGNPSILSALWAPVVVSTALGEELRAQRQLFVGRHVIPRYRGYMRQQGMRLLGLAKASSGQKPGKRREELIAAYGYDTKFAMHAARLGFQCIELMIARELSLPMDDWPRNFLIDLRQGKVPFDDWWELCLELDAKMEKLQDDESIPKFSDRTKIVDLSIRLHERAWLDEEV